MASKFYFSKSRYCEYWQCPKAAWLHKHKPEAREVDEGTLQRMITGDDVGDLAMGLFGDYVEVTARRDDGGLDLGAMIEATAREMEAGTPVICEASFSLEGLYCAVDILRRDEEHGGWAIYEVKSSTHPGKDVYAADIAYQKHVLEGCGVNVCGTYVVCLDSAYVLDGELDVQELFKVADVSEAVAAEQRRVAANLQDARELLASADEPDSGLSLRCDNPYHCAYWGYCTRDLPKPSVFDVYRFRRNAVSCYQEGIVSMRDLLDRHGDLLNEAQHRQVMYEVAAQNGRELPDHVDATAIRKFLGQLSYPLYFLDFETVMPAVPQYQGTRPYAQVPFQYSLHYIEREGGELQHREFLAEPEGDPRRAIAESLVADIPADAYVTAYNKSFECNRLRELADAFPDLADHLRAIAGNIVDLLDPFRAGWYYTRAMGGSFSIKSVLPALFPNDPELDYHALPGVHNGGEAMAAFPLMMSMPPDEREATRKALLAYCELDTLAMVKVWEKLREAAAAR